MNPAPAGPPRSNAPATVALVRSVLFVRRRARSVLLFSALLAALAADIWYEIIGNGIALFFPLDIYFPLFFLVAISVLAVGALVRTRFETFSRDLDARFDLKERLGAAVAYSASRTIPAGVVEAQARESLDAVDFARLRLSFRFRPYGPLLALVLGAATMGWLLWRYPAQFNPRNLVFQQGATLVKISHGLRGRGAPSAGKERNATRRDRGRTTDRPAAPGKQTPPIPGAASKGLAETSKPDNSKAPAKSEGSAKTPESPSGKDSRSAPGSAPGKAAGNSPASSASRESAWRRDQSRAYEETPRVSPVVEKPAGGPDSAFSDLNYERRGGALPPLPFFRLLTGKQSAEALLDPETVTIVLESYPGKYRSHLEAYLKALLARREEKRGS